MVNGMLADDVDDAGTRLLGVVQIGKSVGEPGPKVKECRGRCAGHPEIPVGGAGHDALEQAEHTTHAGDPIQRRDEMHLGCAWVGEADVNTPCDQGPHQTFRTVHRSTPVPEASFWIELRINHPLRLSSKASTRFPLCCRVSGPESKLTSTHRRCGLHSSGTVPIWQQRQPKPCSCAATPCERARIMA